MGRADFAYARFTNAVDFRETVFDGEAWFFHSSFDTVAGFHGARFNDRAIFTRTLFSCQLNLDEAHLASGRLLLRDHLRQSGEGRRPAAGLAGGRRAVRAGGT
ncbi:pentapeptide repeat-containing protein [Amycolatopsis nigrescens]|uniref:pentapeptide repeat-containing protein n=1 Tax=Amycolatopsis nigrescens TaxID=381445 RepID=UPI0003764BBD|nr:pentapeptide repeat-containing protein [Amycolatopsis nigrescens]